MNNTTYNRRDELKKLLDFFTDKLITVNEILTVVSDKDKTVWLDRQEDLKRKLNNVEVELGLKVGGLSDEN